MRLLRRKVRRPENRGKFQLERVIGLTTTNANGLACVSASGNVAYLAGCVVVIYNVILNRQMRFLVSSRTPKALTCVACSQGGKFIAAGESGRQPGIIVWEASKGLCLADLQNHKYGVSCIEFSPNGKHLLSLGFAHDGFLCLWEWKAGTLLSKVRATTAAFPLSTMHFSTDGSFFITAGIKHLKHWTIGMQAIRSHSGVGIGSLIMDAKPVNPGSLKESSFVAVTSLRSFRDGSNDFEPIYALTDSGILSLLHHGLAVKKWVNLKVRQGYALAISRTHIACACSDGIVRLFKLNSLAFSTTLPRPAACGLNGLSDSSLYADLGLQNVKGITYPDAIACNFATEEKLVVIYGDHSLFVWDVHNCSKVVKDQAFFPHSACIWDVASLPSNCSYSTLPTLQSSRTKEYATEMGAFVTCSADGSIRVWRLDLNSNTCIDLSNVSTKELVEVLYNDKQAEVGARESVTRSDGAADAMHGFRSIAISPEGQYLAAGDRGGNLRVYDVHTFKQLSFKVLDEIALELVGHLTGST